MRADVLARFTRNKNFTEKYPKSKQNLRIGYSAAALLAILFCIPFSLRVLIHKETGRWTNWTQAFYHAHFELFLGNGCLGVGVMMLLALTMERYVSICYPGQHTRPLCGSPTLMLVLIPLTTFLIYLPSIFRGEITTCLLTSAGPFIYQKRDNIFFMHSLFYQVYKVVLEIVFKVAPTILLAGFNLRVMIAYRRSCERRRSTTLSRTASNDEAHRTFAEERRLLLLLGSTSILFLVCVSPMVILNVTVSESNLSLYPYQVDSPSFPLLLTVIRYRGSQPSFLVCLFFAQILSPATDIISPQVFRALANLLEVINYSITFYIYCLFSKDFRNTLIRTFHWHWGSEDKNGRNVLIKRSGIPIPRLTNTTTTV
ncbi:probable G-protein coupled receptor AH9.1 isoform X1 [Cephus cinctus]|uniref:Probable G-protein coupled receptor AH9.1 isoform X1 n=1 Tax=Cephus cinctus TaxID=211228 RepID=A0AAJ7RJK9_CEPCN|nr:probable G-protein coupled receptor AH9.1 isoform X1 [Cephus cinctus]